MILIDLNVVLDVVQARVLHYRASATVIDHVASKSEQGALAAYAVTTVDYVVARYRDRKPADETVGWLLKRFQITTVGNHELRQAECSSLGRFVFSRQPTTNSQLTKQPALCRRRGL